MLTSVYEQLPQIDEILLGRRELDRVEQIDPDEMKELIDFLLPFKQLSDQFEVNSGPTLQFVLPGFHNMLQRHCAVKALDSECIGTLKDAALAVINEKYKVNRLHRIATLLYPPMKNLKMLSDIDRYETHAEVQAMICEFESPAIERQLQLPAAREHFKAGIFAEFEDTDDEEVPAGESDELQEYLNLKADREEDVLSFWKLHAKQFPRLSNLAKRLLSIPASSAPSERNFSLAGRAVEKRRASLNPGKVDAILFLNSYWKPRE